MNAAVNGRRVLLADDNQDSTRTFAMLLTLWGHTVEVAHDGEEALRTAESFKPDVALLDIGMPRMDGYEVARRIRSGPDGNRIKLVAVTGWDREEDRLRAAEAGFDRHLVKPVKPDLLRDVVQTI